MTYDIKNLYPGFPSTHMHIHTYAHTNTHMHTQTHTHTHTHKHTRIPIYGNTTHTYMVILHIPGNKPSDGMVV